MKLPKDVKACVACRVNRALFRNRHGRVRWDRHHRLCFQCFRSQCDQLRTGPRAGREDAGPQPGEFPGGPRPLVPGEFADVPVTGRALDTVLREVPEPVRAAFKRFAFDGDLPELVREMANAFICPKTELATWQAGIPALDRELSRARRLRTPISIALFDIDHFRAFNEAHGHLTADRVLRSVAGEVRKRAGEMDLAIRYGGEELILVLPDTDREGARRCAERIRHDVERLRLRGGRVGPVTLSAGVAQARLDDRREQLIDRADRYLYEAKRTGRNRVCA